MLYREIIAVCSQIHTKHINTLCGQNVEFFDVKLVVHKASTRALRGERVRGELMPEEMDHCGNPVGLLTTKRYFFGVFEGFPRCDGRQPSVGRSRQFLGEQS
jgi:hypothetical protein